MRTSDTIDQLATALAKAQGQIHGAAKDSSNPFFKSKYADLASVWEACRGPLSANGLAVIQLPSTEGNVVKLTTRMVHASGQWVEGDVSATAKDEGPQAIGSTVTYLRRYSLQSITGVAPEDDDGNAGQDQANHPAAKRNGKKAEAEKIAAEHGMTTADKLAKPAYETAAASIIRMDTIDKAVKLVEWCSKERIAQRLDQKQLEGLSKIIAEKSLDLCSELADYETADKLLRDLVAKMWIGDPEGTSLRIKLADQKDAKVGAAA